ncbi:MULTISPECIES: LacI family DNA-binding transcriptional regulator [unclassified Solwaraspora]|uniref:LacI family DNA-binding transcriptional regulator n=1 Tax=unclassified Solwaraspora TaxID=2627926 RepID=UPI00248BE983|nr:MULTISPECIES: LacI family DNA-binding transcriptional regulator [unclassified Solwaraspora]WBC00075.1 LacI family DNA-binding transcriptional regulator [Solwaraspora sp. WMMA2059]WBC21380.1 LacI family DNA-binding transcriptional regulator [Solwaraspora sp. WMMA2080]WJK36539.1 LacI family DNA-binding transcriptional regulator [Solwaraspora sp. WMMA2065]
MGASLRSIAERAGVSLATVSNVVNGYRPVAEPTRRRVQQAIDELGYTPNLSARHLRRGRTGLIALAIPELTNPYFAELAETAIREAAALGYTLVMESTDADPDTELALLGGSRRHVVDGLILSPVRIGRAEVLARRDALPLVLIGEGVSDVPHDHIAIDNVAASRAAVAHLVALGRRRIAFIGARGHDDRQSAQLRLRGFRAGIAAAGLPDRPELTVVTDRFGRADGSAAMRRLLTLTEPPDAVLAYNDLIALGAMRAAADAGRRIPQDVAVVGIDDIEEGRYANPSLTSISPDKAAIARLAVRRLVDRIEGRPPRPPYDVRTPFTMAVRQSTVGARSGFRGPTQVEHLG